jgi:hypothetical protein
VLNDIGRLKPPDMLLAELMSCASGCPDCSAAAIADAVASAPAAIMIAMIEWWEKVVDGATPGVVFNF